MRFIVLTMLLLIMLTQLQPLFALEEARFPRPEFTTDYQTPGPTRPLEPLQRNPYLALFLMILALTSTAYGLYVRRSRAWLTVTGLLSLLWFGFVFKGCVCPVGSLQNVFAALIDSSLPVPAHVIAVFLVPLLAALFFGRIFCGAVCPFGVLQDLVRIKSCKIPATLDRILRLLPFFFLGLALYLVYADIGFLICLLDPFVVIFRMSAPFNLMLFSGFTLLLAAFVARPYCRYGCPYSVLLAAATLLSPRRVQVYPDHCTNCRLCLPSCPVDAIVPEVNPGRAFAEPREKAIGRLQWLLALSPFLLALGFYSGTHFSTLLHPLHPRISLLEQVQAKNLELDEVIAFYANDGDIGRLEAGVHVARARIRRGGGWFGMYLALVFIGAAVAVTRRRSNEFHLVESWNCVACGSCYSWCPHRLEKKA